MKLIVRTWLTACVALATVTATQMTLAQSVISDNDGSVRGFQIHGTTKHSNATFNEQDFIEQ